jgi:hypothetical protein
MHSSDTAEAFESHFAAITAADRPVHTSAAAAGPDLVLLLVSIHLIRSAQ